VGPHYYNKRGGLWGRNTTLRGEVCVAYHYTKRGCLCGRIITLRGGVCGAVSLH
jgi:hypothetical protein